MEFLRQVMDFPIECMRKHLVYCISCCPSDIDEFKTATHNCHGLAFCYNNPGSFNCVCWINYTGDGVSCEPVGEWTKTLQVPFSTFG